LKEIERGEFNAGNFINNMKKMVDELVYEVRSNKTSKRISSNADVAVKEAKLAPAKKVTSKKEVVGKTCPKCKKGSILKGSSAFGCSEYKNKCDLKIPFEIYGKKVSENQLIRLLDKGCTTNLKGFKIATGAVEGLIRFDENFSLKLEAKKVAKAAASEKINCPKCTTGTVLKGKTGYGCSAYKTGCNFVFTFDNIKKIANGKPLTKELVLEIISS
jgi:DNA topoisomerase-3